MASIGMPGTVNFIAEIMIIVGSWNKYPVQVIVAMLGIVLTLAYLFKMMRGLFYGPMNQKYGHAYDAISTVDRLPLLIMIAVSIGFGIFPMHLYDVVRSGVDPLIARITQVVPVAETDEGLGMRGKVTTPGKAFCPAGCAQAHILYASGPTRGSRMTFSLNMTFSDLLLLLPEIFLTCWLCVVLIVDFSLPRLPKERLAYLSVAGLVITLGCLGWFDLNHISGTLFGNMFVLDRMAIFFKVFILGSTILVILASIEYVNRFTLFQGGYYCLVVMAALGMMFMASANDLLSVFVSLEFATLGFYVLVSYLRDDLASNEGGLKFFILGVFAAGLLAYGISLVYGETGKLVFSDMTSAQATPGLVIGFLLIFASLGFKDRRRSIPRMDSRYLPWCSDSCNDLFVDRSKSCGLCDLAPHFPRGVGDVQAAMGVPLGGCVYRVDDLWQYRGDSAAQHQTVAGVFGHRPSRECVDRACGGHQNGK